MRQDHKKIDMSRSILILVTFTVFFFGMLNCSGSRQFTLAPVKTVDPDDNTIPPPKELEENQIWDLIDMTGVYQVGKVLDLNWTFGKVGRFLDLTGDRQADNVNVLDEVPKSTWYMNRHYHDRMTTEELMRGPNVTDGPDHSGSWTITRGKFEGGTPGFTIKDAKGDRYILKFDASLYTEMGSSAEVISTKILHAAGYYVPQNTIEYVDPNDLRIGETAKVLDQGIMRQMNRQDLDNMLRDIPRREDGKIRVMASKFLSGKPVGVWEYRGTREDDPNDRVAHQHRRELRALRIIGAWLNDADRRAANTLAVYVEENGKKFVKHYVIDMGSTLGSNNKFPHAPKYGNEYLIDPRTIGRSFVSLGLYVKPWEFEEGHNHPRYTSVGYFESEIFDPASWVPTYPNPAFEKCTLRDAFWGAKIVMAFSDEDLRSIVSTAKMSDKEAEEYLIRTLIQRRDKVGQYWFSQINPLDKFSVEYGRKGTTVLGFQDLAVEGRLETAEASQYVYSIYHRNRPLLREQSVKDPNIILSEDGMGVVDSVLKDIDLSNEEDKIFKIIVRTNRDGRPLSKSVEIYLFYPGPDKNARIVGIVREQ
jgi:hypothetical protein